MIKKGTLSLFLIILSTISIYAQNTGGNTDIDNKGTITQKKKNYNKEPAAFLQGSWGATFPVFGGERLDQAVTSGYDLVGGAKELVKNLPEVGHVMTNLSYFAHSHYFPMSKNKYVDIAKEIHPSIVPSKKNDDIIFDVYKVFQKADKKIILYISTSFFQRADAKVQKAWKAYYKREFKGDEYAAYKNLIKGFIENVKGYADGYWLDTTELLGDKGKIGDFIKMIKSVDPTAAVSANYQKNYFTKKGKNILVDSDGKNDENPIDYKIVKHEPLNSFQDFTNGHVTPLGQGAPPNSFAYEEFTIPNMVDKPWFTYNNKKAVLKHAWFPVREAWHTPGGALVFGADQAYRFVKTVIDGKAAITLANTIESSGRNAGHMKADEMAIMKKINSNLRKNKKYVPYVRPKGASLVGEKKTKKDSDEKEVQLSSSLDNSGVKFYPNPVVNKLTIERQSTGVNYIRIVSVLGAKLMEQKWSNGSLNMELDVSNLESGIYFINLSNDKESIGSKKIIISK